MEEEPTKDLATRAFQKRVLDEFAAIRRDTTEMRNQQAAMAKNIAALDHRVSSIEQRVASIEERATSIEQLVTSIDGRATSIDERLIALEEKVDRRLQETRPIWEAVQEQLQRLVEKFDTVLQDFFELRREMKIHGRRISELERRVLS